MSEENRVTAKSDDKERDEAGKHLGRESVNFKEKEEKGSQWEWKDLLCVFGILALGVSVYNLNNKEKPVNTIMYVREEPKPDTDNDAYERSEPEPPKEQIVVEVPAKRNRCVYFDDF